MLPSLAQLPTGAPGNGAFEGDFKRTFYEPDLRVASGKREARPKPNEVGYGRVVDRNGDALNVMDDAERWRRVTLERMRRRALAQRRGLDTRQLRTMHRTDPIPPVPWGPMGYEVQADESLRLVFASEMGVPKESVPPEAVRAAVRDATGRSSADLARTVRTISDTDGGKTLGWWGFGDRLRKAVPALAAVGVVGAGWIVGALYNAYLLKEEAEQMMQMEQMEQMEQPSEWLDWNSITGSLSATSATSARDARLDKVLIGRKRY